MHDATPREIQDQIIIGTLCIMYDVIQVQTYHSPCGDLLLGSMDDKLCLCDWLDRRNRKRVDNRLHRLLRAVYKKQISDVQVEAIRQLDEYFKHERTKFDVPLLLVGTEFQERVWMALQEIPYGETCTYGELSRRLGSAEAVRAVAGANGANAISIFVPCHRVIGSNHAMIGYAGGVEAKKFLLDLEQSFR